MRNLEVCLGIKIMLKIESITIMNGKLDGNSYNEVR